MSTPEDAVIQADVLPEMPEQIGEEVTTSVVLTIETTTTTAETVIIASETANPTPDALEALPSLPVAIPPPKKSEPEVSLPSAPHLTIPKPSSSHRRSPQHSREKGEGKRKRANTPLNTSFEENTDNNGNEENKDFLMRLPAGAANDADGAAPNAAEMEFPEDFPRPPAPAEAMLTSDELNFLVYRYLLESGFVHSAFVFGGESYISKTNIEDTAQLIPGALIAFVQKGLQYLEIESHINDDGTETVCDESFSVLKPHVCSANTTKKRIFEPYEPMSADYGFLEIDDDEVLFLKGHSDLVTTCVWSPNGQLVASGSADGSARIWDVQNQPAAGKCTTSLLLKVDGKAEDESEIKAKVEEPSKKRPRARKSEASSRSSVLALAWKDDSTIVTGSYDGTTQVWAATGQLISSAVHHQGPVCCVQWAKKGGQVFASGGMDSLVLVQNDEGAILAKYAHHTGPVLDLDWKNDTIFASGSTDKKVCVFELGKPEPIREFGTHRGDVNAVRWDFEGHYLASCGADCAVKVWNVATGACVHDFREHTREVVCIAWAPTSSPSSSSSSSSSSSPSVSTSSPTLLASGSMDTTIKIWDLAQGKCHLTIGKHAHPVTALAFSPQADSLVSGAHERLCLWNTKDGELLRTYKHEGGINHLALNTDGRLAAGYSDHTVCVLDLTSKAEA